MFGWEEGAAAVRRASVFCLAMTLAGAALTFASFVDIEFPEGVLSGGRRLTSLIGVRDVEAALDFGMSLFALSAFLFIGMRILNRVFFSNLDR